VAAAGVVDVLAFLGVAAAAGRVFLAVVEAMERREHERCCGGALVARCKREEGNKTLRFGLILIALLVRV
jgi:hypothetical protein